MLIHRASYRWLLIACAALILTGSATQLVASEPELDNLTAKELLSRMVAQYADCSTYYDSGMVRTVFFQDNGERVVEKPFSTAFVRPDRFRFEYEAAMHGKVHHYIIWREGAEIRTWWDLDPGIKTPTSFSLALAGATGVSGGSAHTVPRMLVSKDTSGATLSYLGDPQRLEDEACGEEQCFRIQGMYVNTPMTLWLDHATFLLRRIDTKKTFDNFRTETTTLYEPVLDQAIAEEILAFAPPVESELPSP